MQRPLFTSRDLASLRIAEQRAERARLPARKRVARAGKLGRVLQLLRRCWAWIEQPDAPVPASRPLTQHFYTQL